MTKPNAVPAPKTEAPSAESVATADSPTPPRHRRRPLLRTCIRAGLLGVDGTHN